MSDTEISKVDAALDAPLTAHDPKATDNAAKTVRIEASCTAGLWQLSCGWVDRKLCI